MLMRAGPTSQPPAATAGSTLSCAMTTRGDTFFVTKSMPWRLRLRAGVGWKAGSKAAAKGLLFLHSRLAPAQACASHADQPPPAG
eukprot:350699-Chlamydomonas_euryale.AAC.2